MDPQTGATVGRAAEGTPWLKEKLASWPEGGQLATSPRSAHSSSSGGANPSAGSSERHSSESSTAIASSRGVPLYKAVMVAPRSSQVIASPTSSSSTSQLGPARPVCPRTVTGSAVSATTSYRYDVM